jgi:glycerol kinase
MHGRASERRAACGAAKWIALRDGLGIIRSAPEIKALASSVPDSGDVFLVPAFAGPAAPHWDAYARGVIKGRTRGTTAAHIARATQEGIAYQVSDILTAMQDDSGYNNTTRRAQGGWRRV